MLNRNTVKWRFIPDWKYLKGVTGDFVKQKQENSYK